jgi:hypothetical protein
MDQAAAFPGGCAGQAARGGHFDRDHPDAEISRDTPDMDEAARQAADGISGGDVDRALDVLRVLWGDEYRFGFDSEHGWWVIKDGHLGSLLTAGSAEELGRQLEEAEEGRPLSDPWPAAPQAAGEGSVEPKVTFRRELFLLRQNWGSAYAIAAGDEPGTAWAKRRDGLGEPVQGTPAEVTRLIAADYRRQPIPRDVAP